MQREFEILLQRLGKSTDGAKVEDETFHKVHLPQPTSGRLQTRLGPVSELVGLTTLTGISLRRVRITESDLRNLRVHDCSAEDSSFDGSDCRGWRVWASSIDSTSFRNCDFRNAVLGGVEGGRGVQYRNVDFSGADLRKSMYKHTVFQNCLFIDSKIKSVNFQESQFEGCIFAGELRDVSFSPAPSESPGRAPERGSMERVDFSRATLRFVEFRGIDLSTIVPPVDPEHTLIVGFRPWLVANLERFDGRADRFSLGMSAYLRAALKWETNDSSTGIVNRQDIRDLFGDEGVKALNLS